MKTHYKQKNHEDDAHEARQPLIQLLSVKVRPNVVTKRSAQLLHIREVLSPHTGPEPRHLC